MTILLLRTLGATALLGLTVAANAQLYGLSSTMPGQLFSISTTTGVAAAIATVTGSERGNNVGLEFLNGVLYATDQTVNANNTNFGTINLATGAFTTINLQGGSANWHGLAADPDANLLYTVDLNTNNLLSVTPSGTITTIGSTNLAISGLAYDRSANILYGADTQNLYTIDTTTGATLSLGNIGAGGNARKGLAFDDATGTLYMNTNNIVTGVASLYTLNVSNGSATLVGNNGQNSFTIDGLAYDNSPVPEPATMLALAGGLATLAMRRRKARLA